MLIDERLSIFQRMLREGRGLPAVDWNQALRKGREFVSPIEEYDPDIMEELRGIAEGSLRRLEEIMLLNVIYELVRLPTEEAVVGCTSLAATPEATLFGHTLAGQNDDWNSAFQKIIIVLKIKQKTRPNIVQVCDAGTVGEVGFNSAGISLFANSLHSDKWRFGGVPHKIIQRQVLNSRGMEEAVAAILRAKRASSHNYLLTHSDGEAIDIEAAPGDANFLFPENGIMAHSNHFIVANSQIRDFMPFTAPNTLFRKYRADKLLDREHGKITVETFKRILRDHFNRPYSICRHSDQATSELDQTQTNVSIILDLDEKTLHVAKGPPCENEYIPFCFRDFVS